MHDLDRLLNINRKIELLCEKIEACEAKNTAPKNQLLSDMPKGKSRTSNEVEDYLIHKEQLCAELDELIESRTINWYAFLNQAAEAHLDARERELLKARFVDGRKWSNCAILMKAVHPLEGWNENKVFRTYRSILYKIEQKNCILC